MKDKIKEQVEKGIDMILEEGLQSNNLDTLYKLVDIHKDLANEEYWESKEEVMEMRYRGYGEYGNDYEREHRGREHYGRGRKRDSRGRYMATDTRRYRGEEMMDEMHEAYRDYSDGREEMHMGNYGAKADTMKSLEYMMESVVDFIEMLKKDATSQEEIQLIQHYTKKINEM